MDCHICPVVQGLYRGIGAALIKESIHSLNYWIFHGTLFRFFTEKLGCNDSSQQAFTICHRCHRCRFVENLPKSKVWRYVCNSSNEKTSFKFGFQTTQLALHRSELSPLKRGSFFEHLCFRWGSRTEVPFEVVSSVNQMSVSRPDILRGTTGWKFWSYTKLLDESMKAYWKPQLSPNALTTGECTGISGDCTKFVPGIFLVMSLEVEITKMLSPHVTTFAPGYFFLFSENHRTTSMIQWTDGCRRAASEHSTVASQFLWFWCALIIIHGTVCESKFSTFSTSMICIEAINPAIMNTLITSMLRHWL